MLPSAKCEAPQPETPQPGAPHPETPEPDQPTLDQPTLDQPTEDQTPRQASPRLERCRVTWLGYAQIGLWSYAVCAFAPTVPLLRAEQHTSRMVASLHSTAFAAGTLAGALISGWLAARLDRNARTVLATATLAAAVLGLVCSTAFPATISWVALLSASGNILINTATSALSDRHGPAGAAAISEGNALGAGIGLCAPLAVAASVAVGLGWRAGMAVAGIAAVVLLAVSTRLRIRLPAQRGPASARGRAGLPRRYWIAFLIILTTTSVELCVNLWVSDILRGRVGMSAAQATATISAIIGGMLVGRLALGRLVLRRPVATTMLGGILLATAGFTVFWLATSPLLAVPALIVYGLGGSVFYPLGIALAIEHSGGQPDLATARSSYAFATASGTAPFALGTLADNIGPHSAFLLVPALLAVASALIVVLVRTRRTSPGRRSDCRRTAG